MDGGEANLRLKGGLNLLDSSDPASLYVSFPLSQGFTFPPSVSLPPLRRWAANGPPRPWRRHMSTESLEEVRRELCALPARHWCKRRHTFGTRQLSIFNSLSPPISPSLHLSLSRVHVTGGADGFQTSSRRSGLRTF